MINFLELWEQAQLSFWKVVAEKCPEIKTGDMLPEHTIAFDKACVDAVKNWLATNSKPRFGKVVFKIEYAVDLNNQGMVDHAKDAIADDILDAVKYDNVFKQLKVVTDPELEESDIPEFLKEEL